MSSTNFSVSLEFKKWGDIFKEFKTDSPSEAVEKLWDGYNELKEKVKK